MTVGKKHGREKRTIGEKEQLEKNGRSGEEKRPEKVRNSQKEAGSTSIKHCLSGLFMGHTGNERGWFKKRG